MYVFLMLLIILIGAVMTVAILMQNPKGGGLSSAFGGAGGGFGSMLGVRHASDILAKTTWGLAIAMTILIFMLNMFFLPTQGTEESIIQRGNPNEPMSPVQKSEQMQAPVEQAPAEQAPTQQAPPPSDQVPGQ
jgi:preprotein translocase subunit SecG